MSTLATNKLGTLAGTADISVPTTRPSSTLPAQLDSSGNLSFSASESRVNTIVNAKDNKVGIVLVDQIATGLQSDAGDIEVEDGSSGKFKGFAVGMHNASDADKTNYLFEGNIRQFEINFCWYNNKSSSNGNANGGMTDYSFFTPLDSSGKRLWKTTQNSNCMYGRTYENPDSNGANYSQGSATANFPSNSESNNSGYFRSYNGNYPGTSVFGKIYWHCGVNSTWQAFYQLTKLYYNRSSGDMYPEMQSGYVMPSSGTTNNARSQTGGSSSKGYGQPWEIMGGVGFNGQNTSSSPFDMFNAQMYAYIKPTDLALT
tara:strand:- start:1381 stop:2325 length:945 start_codon:yes stop_codon:yes gene_type:complete